MEEEELDIAATMGFSSFGGAPKKRKHSQTNSPNASSSTGANSMRLGVRPKLGEAEKEEGRLGQGEEEEEVIQSTEPIPANEAKAKGKQPASSLADFLSRGHALPDKPPAPSQPFPATTSTSQHQHSHEFNPSSSETVSFGGAPISKFELNALRQGVRNENGDVAYFLPSFVEEDPWAGLKAQGQDPAGVRTASGR